MGSARHFLISGKVQGVSFRVYTSNFARGLGLTGWVRNLSDGRVEVLAQGGYDKLMSLYDFLYRAAPHAVVQKVDSFEVDGVQNFLTFDVVEDGETAWQKK